MGYFIAVSKASANSDTAEKNNKPDPVSKLSSNSGHIKESQLIGLAKKAIQPQASRGIVRS